MWKIYVYMNQKNQSFKNSGSVWIMSLCETLTNTHVDSTQPSSVLGTDNLVVEETGSISTFIEKWIKINVILVSSYPFFCLLTEWEPCLLD